MNKKMTNTPSLSEKEEKVLKRYFRIMFKCDRVRFINPLTDKIFLVLGTKKNTKESSGTSGASGTSGNWIDQNRQPQNWDYFEESTIASGKNIPELISNAKRYKSLQGKRAIDILMSEIKGKR